MYGLILAAVTQVASPVKVDGVLDEAVWKSAEWRDDFKRLATQTSMGPLTRKTAFAIVSDAHTLYLGVRCEEPNVERLKGGKDIDIWIGDSVEFFFAPTGGHFDYYHFGISPVSSTLFATFHSEGGAITPDPFAPSWTRACAFGEKEWTAEVAIPLSAFYMTRNADWQTTWLFDMTRTFRQPSEYASWSQMEVKFGEPKRFSRLAGFPKRSDADDFRAWSVIPEVTGRSEKGIETRLDLEVYTAVAGEYEATLSEGVAPTRLNLAKGVNRVSLAAVYPDNGRYKTRFTFRRLADGTTFERRHTVTIDYQPIRVRLTTPQYRNNFYPGQKVEKVEGAATVLEKGLAEVTLEGPGFARQTVRVASGEKFTFDVRGFQLGDATLTVKTAANEKTVKVRNLPPTKAQMVWIEDGHLVVNGKPVLRRNLYAEFYKGGEKLDAKYRREIDSFHTTPAFARYLDIQPDRVIAGLERKEAVKDVKPCAAYFAAVDRMIEANRDTDFGYYYIIDEPECRGISQVYLQHIYDYVSEKDPYHPILTASRGGKRYLSCVDWIETHPYLSPRNMKDGRRYGRHPNEMGDFLDAFGCWDRGDKAVGFLPTCFAYRWQTTVEDYPTFDEYVLHYWAAMMRGGKSLWPYAYHDVGDRPALWDGTKYMFECFEALEDLVILGRRTGCRKDKDAEIVRYDLADDALLVAVNFRKEEQTVTLPSFAGTLGEFRGARTFAGGADVSLRPFEALILTRKPHDAGLEPFASVRARIQAAEDERTHRDNQLLERYDDITYESNFNGGHGSGFYKLVDGMYDQLAKGSSDKPDRYWQLNFRNGLKPRFDRLVVHGSGTFDEVETSVFADGVWTKLPVVRREKTDKYRVVITFDRPYVAEKVRFDFAGRKGSRNAFELYEIELPRIASGIHAAALTPITEDARPSGGPMRFVENGKLNFAIVADLKTEGTIGARSEFSVRPAVDELTNAFRRCFGTVPEVFDFREVAGAQKVKYVLYVGDQPAVRELGVDCRALPSQGFRLTTFEKGLVIAGNDSSLVPNYSAERYDGRRTSSGTLFGALDFCERFLDVRWYFPGPYGSLYPKRTDLTVEPVAYSDEPYFNERQEPYFLRLQNWSEADCAHWAEYLGYRPKLREESFSRYLRIGGSIPKAGMHCPDPVELIKHFPDRTNLCFYTSPNGHFWCAPSNPELCYLNVFDLKFADFLVDEVYKPYFESKGEIDLGGLYPYVSKEYISFGQCDNKLSDAEWKDHPLAKELGLKTMGDVYCRFQQHLAKRIAKEFPGTKLFVLSYYNQADATEDPRWMLPENFDVMFCAGALPKYTRRPEKLAPVMKRAHDWYVASGNRPMSKIWLYTETRNPFLTAMIPEFVGEVPGVMGKYLGRDGCMFNYGGRQMWHYFWCPYVSFRSQWNPKLDVDAAIDEMWLRMYGPEAGAHLTRFHRLVKKGYLEHYLEGRDVYPTELVDAAERELEAAGACLAEGSVEYRRWKLVRDFWPKAFAQQRVRAAYRPPVYEALRLAADETLVVDGVLDSAWARAPVMPLAHPTDPTAKPTRWPTTVKFRWDDRGLYLLATADWEPIVTPDADIWKENDLVELFVCPGLGKEVLGQFVWDLSSRFTGRYQRHLPVIQPGIKNWKPEGVVAKASVGSGKWTLEAFVPFAAFPDFTPPKAGEEWNINVVRDKSEKGLGAFRTVDSVSSSFTMDNNSRREMFGTIRFSE